MSRASIRHGALSSPVSYRIRVTAATEDETGGEANDVSDRLDEHDEETLRKVSNVKRNE